MASGDTVTIDTLSHEGILSDQGRDPVGFLGGYGVKSTGVLRDAQEIAASTIPNGPDDGPHVVTGPIAVTGAQPGDVLKVEGNRPGLPFSGRRFRDQPSGGHGQGRPLHDQKG